MFDNDDALCLFNHEKANNDLFKVPSNLNCRICNKDFKNRGNFMNNRKYVHSGSVPLYKNYLKGS